MPAPNPLPKYIYKIVPSEPPSPLPAEYPLSELDQKDGFVHLSTAAQVPITASLFFAELYTLWIVKIRFAGFEDKTKWEVEGNDGCAHLYDANFGAANIEGFEEFMRADEQDWNDAMKLSTWLV